MCRHFALGGLLGVLVMAAQVGPARAYGHTYDCTSDVECQYDGCHDISCACSSSVDSNCVNGFWTGHSTCNNGVWDAICYNGRCGYGWYYDGSYNYHAGFCPEPPAGWPPADPSTAEPTTTPKPTTTRLQDPNGTGDERRAAAPAAPAPAHLVGVVALRALGLEDLGALLDVARVHSNIRLRDAHGGACVLDAWWAPHEH